MPLSINDPDRTWDLPIYSPLDLELLGEYFHAVKFEQRQREDGQGTILLVFWDNGCRCICTRAYQKGNPECPAIEPELEWFHLFSEADRNLVLSFRPYGDSIMPAEEFDLIDIELAQDFMKEEL